MGIEEIILEKLKSELIPGLGPSSLYYEFGYNEGIKTAMRIIKEAMPNDNRKSNRDS